MMHTEDEAKKLWCPMVRLTTEVEGHYCLSNREKPLRKNTEPGSLSHCIASGCAMWRWAYNWEGHYARNGDDPLGFCGLAGRPDQ